MDTQVCTYWGVGGCWEEVHMLEANNHLEVLATMIFRWTQQSSKFALLPSLNPI